MDRKRFIKIVKESHFAYISKGVRQLNIEAILNSIESLDFNLPLVSVGSGNAFFEWLLCCLFPKLTIIMIDPAPFSYIKLPEDIIKFICKDVRFAYLQTGEETKYHFNFVKNLIKNRDIIGKCNVMLNWPDVNYSTYDYDSILDLKPQKFMAIFAPCGASGGEKFIETTREQSFMIEDIKYVRQLCQRESERRSFTTVHYELTVYQRDDLLH